MSQHEIPEKNRSAMDTHITKWEQGTVGLRDQQSEVEKQCKEL